MHPLGCVTASVPPILSLEIVETIQRVAEISCSLAEMVLNTLARNVLAGTEAGTFYLVVRPSANQPHKLRYPIDD